MKTKQKTILLGLIGILSLCFLVLVYILFWKKETKDRKPFEISGESGIIWKQIQSNPETLVGIGYPQDLRDFLESVRGKETYLFENDRTKTKDFLLAEYPDERGEVLFALYLAFREYTAEKRKIDSNTELSEIKKLMEIKRLQSEIFPEYLRTLIFPEHPIHPTRLLLYTLQDFVEKNPFSYSRERKLIFLKKRKEIYGEKEREIRNWEDPDFWNRIIELLYEREMSDMEEKERSQFHSKRLEEFKIDFWN